MRISFCRLGEMCTQEAQVQSGVMIVIFGGRAGLFATKDWRGALKRNHVPSDEGASGKATSWPAVCPPSAPVASGHAATPSSSVMN
jgi:hypothetical protein